jgi:membrane associated rhomboid family serine protease
LTCHGLNLALREQISKISRHIEPPMENEQPEQYLFNDADEYSVVAQGTTSHLAACSLVLSAMGIDHLQTKTSLLVPPEYSDEAGRQLRAYQLENSNWPPPPAGLQEQKQTPPPPTLLMIGGLFLFYQVTGSWQPGNPWFEAGAIDSTRIFEQGQWWRLITALSLHADGMHLLGNCLIGGFMVHLLCKTIGYGSGWLLLLLTGALGNLINIAVRSTTHHSVGFSTAVFAAIGMFSGLQLKNGKNSPLNIIIPLGAGAGLLAFLGTEGKQTDLGAHLFGFCCGIVAGLLTNLTGLVKAADKHVLQRIFFVVALALISLCWWLAATNSPVTLM